MAGACGVLLCDHADVGRVGRQWWAGVAEIIRECTVSNRYRRQGIDNLTVRIAQIQGSSHRYRWSQYSIAFRRCHCPQAPREIQCRMYFSGGFIFYGVNTLGCDTFAGALQGKLGTKIPKKKRTG